MQMQNRMVVLLCNLKPAKTRGVLSQAVVMCASSPAKVEILDPPGGAAPGDRVTVQGFPGTLTDSSATWSLHFTTTSNHQEYHKDITEWPVKHIAVFRKWLILLPRNKKSWFHTAQCASNIFLAESHLWEDFETLTASQALLPNLSDLLWLNGSEIPAASFHNLVESFPRRLEAACYSSSRLCKNVGPKPINPVFVTGEWRKKEGSSNPSRWFSCLQVNRTKSWTPGRRCGSRFSQTCARTASVLPRTRELLLKSSARERAEPKLWATPRSNKQSCWK